MFAISKFLCFIAFIYVLYIYNLKLAKISCFVKNRKSINHNSGQNFHNSGRLCNAGLNYAKMKKYRSNIASNLYNKTYELQIMNMKLIDLLYNFIKKNSHITFVKQVQSLT